MILDASALIALIMNESGSQKVAKHLPTCRISSINLCETISYLVRNHWDEAMLSSLIDDLNLTIYPFTKEDALVAAHLIKHTKHKGLSLGDRACLALAQRLNAPALTADKVWLELTSLPHIQIELIR